MAFMAIRIQLRSSRSGSHGPAPPLETRTVQGLATVAVAIAVAMGNSRRLIALKPNLLQAADTTPSNYDHKSDAGPVLAGF